MLAILRIGLAALAWTAIPLVATPALAVAPPVRAIPPASLRQPVQQTDTRPVLRVTKEEARAKALAAMQGEVTAVDLERKRGRVFWVVEMQTPKGDEIDVLVDVESGEVVGVDDVDD
jgi:hypothetical protein